VFLLRRLGARRGLLGRRRNRALRGQIGNLVGGHVCGERHGLRLGGGGIYSSLVVISSELGETLGVTDH
jgi:hypothetical protein